jgi:hypothetical protein
MNRTRRLRPADGGSGRLRRVCRSRLGAVALGAAMLVGVGGTGVVALTGTPSGTNWGIVDRLVKGNGDAYLRTGPTFVTGAGEVVAPPRGEGSLGLRTGSTSDQTAFGKSVGFFDDPLSSLSSVGFSVFTTDQNNRRGPRNMPSIVIEIDPNLAARPDTDSSRMIFLPPNGTADRWTTFDATNSLQVGQAWGLTGAAGNATGCQFRGSLCTWDRIQAELEDGDGNQARIRSILIAKLRDQPFSGAVDALRIGATVFNFEPLEVLTGAP